MLLARNWWAVALRGLLAIAFGIIALVWPGLTMLTLLLIFAAYLIVDGVFAIVSAINAARERDRWVMLALSGVLSILAGGIAFAWPGITLAALLILIAAWSIVSGVLTFASAFRLNIEHGRIWLALGGIAQLAFGILLLAAPAIGAVVLTWWLGIYAIIFGVFMLVLAFQLRSRLEEPPAAMPRRSSV
jgi:uncharacterized membrane protein HdeD (DUF308 family)